MTMGRVEMVDPRRPVHLAVLAGLSAGTYAFSLACVTSWQSSTDAATAAGRAPSVAVADSLTQSHDALEARIADASRTYTLTASDYDRLTPRLELAEKALDDLTRLVGKVTGSVGALPTHVSLPKVSVSAPAAKKPVVHATTGASG
jgi:hypothetical protein